uniref:LOB domain-containing protein n=1 Tax=Oryza brachyantha TaxID=4533 RepID=J3LLY3_ORYBR
MSSGGGASSALCGGGGGGGAGGGVGGGPSGSGGGGPCGACKFLRRKCVSGCIFAPYFDSEQGAAHFAAVHKVFGASNVSKLLLQIPAHKRPDAVVTICYEAQARLRDPVYGCVAHIFALQQQMPMPAPFSISDLPSSTSVPTTVDLSALFDPPPQPQWAPLQHQPQQHHHHQQQHQLRQQSYGTLARAASGMPAESSGGGGGDLQALARELLDRHRLQERKVATGERQ